MKPNAILYVSALCCLILAGCDVEQAPAVIEQVPAAYERPKDVKAMFNRAEQCQHWAGEEAYNRERGKEILRAVNRLRCETLEDDYIRLHHKHADDANVIRDMETTNIENDFEFLYPAK